MYVVVNIKKFNYRMKFRKRIESNRIKLNRMEPNSNRTRPHPTPAKTYYFDYQTVHIVRGVIWVKPLSWHTHERSLWDESKHFFSWTGSFFTHGLACFYYFLKKKKKKEKKKYLWTCGWLDYAQPMRSMNQRVKPSLNYGHKLSSTWPIDIFN